MPKANSTFGFDKPEDSPGFLLWQTTITWQRLIKKALEFSGISHPQFVILAITLWFENQASRGHSKFNHPSIEVRQDDCFTVFKKAGCGWLYPALRTSRGYPNEDGLLD